MRQSTTVILVLLISISSIASYDSVSAREIDRAGLRIRKSLMENENIVDIDQGTRTFVTSAEVDSYCIVWYDFEVMDFQGWEQVDYTAGIDTFFHVEDFAGLGGGTYGYLHPLEGFKSMWCGTRPAGDSRAYVPYWYLCSWNEAPGYGNGWDDRLTSGRIDFRGILTFSYHALVDSEPDFDFLRIEYDAGVGNWLEIARYDGTVDTIPTHDLRINKASTKLRFHFTSDGAWSDQDGLWNSDGAAIIDSITVADLDGVINYEDWEYEDIDQKSSDDGFWQASRDEGYGIASGLANNLVDQDPCGDNFGTQVVFYFSDMPHPSADYPGLWDTPFCKGPGGTSSPCQNEGVVSPVIDLTTYSSSCNNIQDTPIPPSVLPDLGGAVLRFTIYRDMPLANLVFYHWSIRQLDGTGCPLQWLDREFVYYGADKDYIQSEFDVSDLVVTDQIQISLDVVDMCDVWFDIYGDCATHTPSPWFDNVRFYRYSKRGPQWGCRDLDLFQDNFPSKEFDMESFVRADAANDLRRNDDPVIDPGDSAVVSCSAALAGGLDTTAAGDEAVFCHVWVEYIGDDGLKSDLFGPILEGSWGSYASDDGSRWTIFLCPNARSSSGWEAEDRFMIDLNDSLFTRGYRINYYFKATDLFGHSSTLPPEAEAGGDMFEFTCLPTLNSPLLFVDDFHGRGTFDGTVQTYWDQTFNKFVSSDGNHDRYDVNSPSSLTSNGPGSRAKQYQLDMAYEVIIWDSGNLGSGTITEGTDHSDKSNDAQMLIEWLDLSDHKTGLWVLGDDVASDLSGSPAPAALALTATYCGVECTDDSYYELTGGRNSGGVVTPLVTGLGIYSGLSYYAFGGCPIVNRFDVLETTGTGAYSLQLPDFEGSPYYIGISNIQLNSLGYPMRTSWIGHSLMYVRNAGAGNLIRNDLLYRTQMFFENDMEWVCPSEIPACYSLEQNYPNPFNPVTQISFNMPEKGMVILKVYNVAGQLVRTLAEEERDAGTHTIAWDGKNGHGSTVASGVYFYRMEAGDFTSTKKMILLR